ncbi:MAG TPA: right-handed parallel beta-helix repeat-containing protein [Bryobacteraceae bacterium]|nr:right-handed parallel beta-helix repeat-containing protein [Bryobacteraceae bacterium]
MLRTCLVVLALTAPVYGGLTYHVDCASGSDAAAGTAPASAWRTLAKASATTLAPGDSLLLKRGTVCSGALAPRGSGSEGQPIRLGAYGTGPLPVVNGGSAKAALRLSDQHHWEIEGLELVGGDPYGVLITGTKGTLKHLRLRNLVVRDVTGTVKAKGSGLVCVLAPAELVLEDILIDGVTAYNTTQWAGIIVQGGSRENRARNVTIRNSVVHDVFGDGIVLFNVENGLIEKSAAWLTGLQPTQTVGTPNGIWTWRCRNCTVQLTEGFWIDSPGVDGGVYDIDWGNDDNIVQQNYGHDAQGYCASVFAASKEVTTNSVIRYNVCVANGRSPKLARRQGDLYISTWDGGSLDGVLIHNNTFIWTPPIDAPVLQMDQAEFSGKRPNLFANNVIASTVPSMIHSNRSLGFQGNVYWYAGNAAPAWAYGGTKFSGLEVYAKAAGGNEVFAPPRLDELLRPAAGSPLIDAAVPVPGPAAASDAYGTKAPQGARPDIGALEHFESQDALKTRPSPGVGKHKLILRGDARDPQTRSQLVFLQTALAQYGDTALTAELALANAPGNVSFDWSLGNVRLLSGERDAFELVLRAASGGVLRRWDRFAAPADLGVTLRHYLGAPVSSPTFKVPGL